MLKFALFLLYVVNCLQYGELESKSEYKLIQRKGYSYGVVSTSRCKNFHLSHAVTLPTKNMENYHGIVYVSMFNQLIKASSNFDYNDNLNCELVDIFKAFEKELEFICTLLRDDSFQCLFKHKLVYEDLLRLEQNSKIFVCGYNDTHTSVVIQ